MGSVKILYTMVDTRIVVYRCPNVQRLHCSNEDILLENKEILVVVDSI